MLGADSEMAVILSAEELTIGDHKAVQVTTARSFNLEDTTTSIAFRLSPETVLLVAAYPNSGLYSNDVQTILSTLVLDKSTPIVKPTTAPHPALTANSDPPSPGALPPSATCDTGYLGVLEESIDLITNSIETGNHYPLSYTIGNPFVIGYWRSEGVALPREEAYQQLTENYLPSPEEVVIITDPAQFPNLDGMPLDSFWGPDVDVVANLYSKGWGPDRQGEAILVIARCQGETYNAYFWYGMLYALSGFE